MSTQELDRVIGTALADPGFQEILLTSRRREALAHFDLSPEEEEVLMRIQAPTLEAFARALYGWMSARNGIAPLLSTGERESGCPAW